MNKKSPALDRKASKPLLAFETARSSRNVVLNFMGSADTEFGPFGGGFHEAAKLLAEPLLRRGVHHDMEGPPVVYMYRHALELHFKAVLLAGNRLLALDGKGIEETQFWKKLHTHKLSDLLSQLEGTFQFMGWKEPFEHNPIETFADIRSVIVDLERVDPNSFSFRYPTTKVGDPALSHHFSFGPAHFVAVMNALIDFFANCVSALEDAWDKVCEGFSKDE